MAEPVKLEKYQILIAPDSKKVQGLRIGDIVRRQYFDGTNIIYSLMCVLAYGTTKRFSTEAQYDSNGKPILDSNGKIVTQNVERDVPYFIGALLEGDAPQTKELLDFARITSLFDTNRSGALYLTASDDNAPFMDVIDGVGRNKSLCWPENIANEGFEDAHSQYIVRGSGLTQLYKDSDHDEVNKDTLNRIIRLTRDAATTDFSGLSQDFYELVAAQKRVLISYKARANKNVTVNAEIAYTNDDNVKDAQWTENFTSEWQYYFQAVNVINSGRHLRTFRLDLKSLGVNDWVEIADFNIILLDSISNFGDATSMRIGKLDGVVDPVFGTLTGYGAYIQKLYASQTAHISGTLTAGDENGFASTFYAGKIHRNCFRNSCDVNFQTPITIDNKSLINPTGMGNVYKTLNSIELKMFVQSREWLDQHLNKRYCFSFWAYAKKPCQIGIKQNDKVIGTIQIASSQTHEWRRLHLFFDLLKPDSATDDMQMSLTPSFSNSLYQSVAGSIVPDEQELYFTAPQLEIGEYCTQYQPTDDILNETDDYGAWMARGGIGGTIQNPLLKLNADGEGAIASRTDSFRLNQDGSGHLAMGNIKWHRNGNVEFGENVKLNWGNIGNDVQDKLKTCSVKIQGSDTFSVVGEGQSTIVYTPEQIQLTAIETNITNTIAKREWYRLHDDEFVLIEDVLKFNKDKTVLTISPDDPELWEEGDATLTVKYEVVVNDETVSDVFTIRKYVNNGYSVVLTSSSGDTFRNGSCNTVLTATIYYANIPVPEDFIAEHFMYVWRKYHLPDTENEIDEWWVNSDGTEVNRFSKELVISGNLTGSDCYVCEIMLRKDTCFPYNFPILF